MLGLSCPSLYDLRNIFQVNVEKAVISGPWSTCYTVISAAMARRSRVLAGPRSGDTDNPRILGAFNEPTPDWLAFYMFTFFTDRDGKFQLCALAESVSILSRALADSC